MTIRDEALPGWTFRIEEVSAGVYQIQGSDRQGRSVARRGTDPDVLLAQCKQDAAAIQQKRSDGRP